MLAAIAVVLFIVAAILKLVGKHADWLLWLVIIGGALVSIEVAWFLRRHGWYRTPG
jgi:high-affinity Fe2+/Pb2+ permease